jgi:hypothetical protein
MKYLIIAVIVIAIVVLMPFATIWSINTLFGLTIPFTLDTWLASLILGGVVGGTTGLSFKK